MHSKLQHLWELSWPARASIISGVCADQTKKGTRHFQMLVAGWLGGWVGGCCGAWLAGLHRCILICRGHVWLLAVVHHANLLLTCAKQCLTINTGPFLKPRVSKSTRIHWRTQKCGQNWGQIHEIDHTNQSKKQGDLQNLAAGFASCLAAAFLGVSMTCKCIHHPERQVCRSIQEGNYIFPNVGGLLTCRLAG